MQGLHLTADLSGCSSQLPIMQEPLALLSVCRDAVAAAQLGAVAERFHAFEPAGSGITGVILLAESHLAVHTWPELAAVTLDVYVCNVGSDNSDKAHQVLAHLLQAFAPAQVERHALHRGSPWPAK